jgi:hypothetical protein
METQEKTSIKESAEDLLKHVGDYLDTLYKKLTLTATEKAVKAGASMISSLFVVVLGFFALFFAGLGLGWLVGNWINDRAAGFFIVAGVYLVLLLIIAMAGKKTVIPYLRNLLTRKIYD